MGILAGNPSRTMRGMSSRGFPSTAPNATVRALCIYGDVLVAAGDFTTMGGGSIELADGFPDNPDPGAGSGRLHQRFGHKKTLPRELAVPRTPPARCSPGPHAHQAVEPIAATTRPVIPIRAPNRWEPAARVTRPACVLRVQWGVSARRAICVCDLAGLLPRQRHDLQSVTMFVGR
jgi:hypothetical protein